MYTYIQISCFFSLPFPVIGSFDLPLRICLVFEQFKFYSHSLLLLLHLIAVYILFTPFSFGCCVLFSFLRLSDVQPLSLILVAIHPLFGFRPPERLTHVDFSIPARCLEYVCDHFPVSRVEYKFLEWLAPFDWRVHEGGDC